MKRTMISGMFGFSILLLGLFASCSTEKEKAKTNPEPVNCSTGSFWTSGDSGSSLMHPGGNCNSCHTSSGEGPIYGITGTVQGALTDNIDCNGLSGVTVTLTGANGETQNLTTNSAGNFFGSATVTAPYTASITKAGTTMQMVTAQSSFDCASCHADGATTQGRIYLTE